MMREILFRGKRYDNGNWCEGYLIHDEHCNRHIPYIGYLFDAGHDIDVAEIILGTVGQFTGLTDINNKKIFEGDIVQAYFRNNHTKQIFRVVFDDGMFIFDNNHVKVPKYEIYAKKVIGNIHDNPELLEKTT